MEEVEIRKDTILKYHEFMNLVLPSQVPLRKALEEVIPGRSWKGVFKTELAIRYSVGNTIKLEHYNLLLKRFGTKKIPVDIKKFLKVI